MKKDSASLLASQFTEALATAKIKIFKYDPSKGRCITTNTGGTFSLERFMKVFSQALGARIVEYPEVQKTFFDAGRMGEALRDYSKSLGVLVDREQRSFDIPDSYKELTLNIDQSHTGRDLKTFMTTPSEYISHVSGTVWARTNGMSEEDVIAGARKVVPEYRPRDKPGIVTQKTINGESIPVYNSYIPPSWREYEGDLPDKLPILFSKLVRHLFPIALEREYFFAWLYDSLFRRAFVYLILCGPGGTGKNRLKLVMRALHGHQNTVDGKRSTLSERFNSQLADATLAWYDELSYNRETENIMKEIQNDSISIERKGVDATRSTRIYASSAISNNKPRDNYIAFDARKFVPLQIASTRLDTAMTAGEIETITNKVENWSSATYDIKFVAQIGRWIKKHGMSRKWHHLEYKGPMFYKLAHTSMSRWQKKAASLIIDGTTLNNSRIITDQEKGYLWGSIAEQSQKKNGDRSMQFPDYTTVKHFFDIFVDGEGGPAFKTVNVSRDIMGDFYVKLINKKARILTETEMNKAVGEEVYDL